MALPRPDLSSENLLYLSIFKIYVSTSSRSVSTYLNRIFSFKPRLTTRDVEATYVILHDTENEIWVRAKCMNTEERVLLKTILKESGVRKRVWNKHTLKPAGPTACFRLPTSPRTRQAETEVDTSQMDYEQYTPDLRGTFMVDSEEHQQNTANARE